MNRTHLLALFVAALITGCSGGKSAEESSVSSSPVVSNGSSSSVSSAAASASSGTSSSAASSSVSSVTSTDSSSSQSSYSVTSVTSNPGTTSIQAGSPATMGDPTTVVFNGLRSVLDTQVRFPKHGLSGAVGTLPTTLANEGLPYVPEVRVLARRDTIILYFGNVAGAADYRAYAVTNNVSFTSTSNGQQPRGAVIACAGFRQHTYQSATVGGYHTREVVQAVELPGFTTAGTYTVVLEATQTPCPFVGMPGHTDAQITMMNNGTTNAFHTADPTNYRYTGIPRAVIRSFDTIKQQYGNEIINGQGSAMSYPNRETEAVIGGVVAANDSTMPSDPRVIARSAISIQMPYSDEDTNAPTFDTIDGQDAVFDDFATDAVVTPSSMTQNPDYSAWNSAYINPLFVYNNSWEFWGRFMQAADSTVGTHASNYWSNQALLGTQVFSRHGRLYTTFGDNDEDVGGTLGFASITAPVQKMDSTKFIHSMFRVNSEASHRRYWWWTMCGSANRTDLFDDTTKRFKLRPTVYETSFNIGGNNPTIPDGHTLESASPSADNTSAKECLTIEQRGVPVSPFDTSGTTRSSGVLRAMIHPAGYSHGARFLGNTLSDEADSVLGFRYKVDAQGNRVGPMIEPFDQEAPLVHYDIFVRRDRLVVFVNGRQGFCVDLSDIPLTMNYGEIVYGDLLYHSSIEWQELSNSATNKDPQMYHTMMNTPIASSRVWDVISHADNLDIPSQFSTYDPTACRKPSVESIQ